MAWKYWEWVGVLGYSFLFLFLWKEGKLVSSNAQLTSTSSFTLYLEITQGMTAFKMHKPAFALNVPVFDLHHPLLYIIKNSQSSSMDIGQAHGHTAEFDLKTTTLKVFRSQTLVLHSYKQFIIHWSGFFCYSVNCTLYHF